MALDEDRGAMRNSPRATRTTSQIQPPPTAGAGLRRDLLLGGWLFEGSEGMRMKSFAAVPRTARSVAPEGILSADKIRQRGRPDHLRPDRRGGPLFRRPDCQ